MPHVCPRPCSRLATAAVFISVGVVQFVVGIILLRSKYVYLLAGPDFLTAFINIIVGCLLGVTASVWKRPKKRPSKKHIVRRNIVLALLFSGMLMNVTTLGILLLGEGNTLMAIRLESSGKYTNQTFVSEILAYAYATSVCSPIVCIVVAIVAMAGNCFEKSARKNSVDLKLSDSSLKKERSQSLQWVYTPELFSLSKKSPEKFLTSSSESEDETSDDVSTCERKANSAEELQDVFNRMAHGKRDSILSDSTVMLRQLEQRRKTKHNSLNQDGSYLVPILPQTEKSAFSENKRKRDDLIDHGRLFARSRKSSRLSYDKNSLSTGDIALKPLTHLRSKQSDTPCRSSCNTEEDLSEYQNVSAQLAAKNFSVLKRNAKQKHQTDAEKDTAVLRRKSEERQRMKAVLNDFITDQFKLKRKYESSQQSNGKILSKEVNSAEVLKPGFSPEPELIDCFSPEETQSESYLFDVPRRSSWAGEIIPISVKKSPFRQYSQKLIPVQSPVVPSTPETSIPSKLSVAATIESNCTDNQNQKTPERTLSMASFRENMKSVNSENSLEYPKTGSQSIKKHDFAKMSMMASISEELNSEMPQYREKIEVYSRDAGATPKLRKGHLNKKSLTSAYSESSTEMNQNEGNRQNDRTPDRKMSASCKTLRRIWSSGGSERDADLLGQVVDEDSLIGLSEEELIARQFRNRSIRKALQQRLRNEIII